LGERGLFLPDDTPLFAPQRRERRVTSLAGWRHSLPSTTPAAPAIPTTKPARRTVTVEQLLAWAYRDQKVHRYLRRPYDWFLWALDDAGLAEGRDRRPVHHDAAIVHEAVIGLGEYYAHRLVHFAALGERPERITSEPLPESIEPSSRHQKYGWFTDAAGRRHDYVILVAEVISFEDEEWESAGRKKMRRAATRRTRFEVEYCPIGWRPDPSYIEMVDGIAADYEAGIVALRQALATAELRAHVLAK
jgi:hypothetical protein